MPMMMIEMIIMLMTNMHDDADDDVDDDHDSEVILTVTKMPLMIRNIFTPTLDLLLLQRRWSCC
jgi:hypothetical protein